MDKNIEISILCQVYGKVLTPRQLEVLEDYYNEDLSLSEIAENNNITRQAVRDIIKKSENKLYELEDKISIVKEKKEQKKIINKIEEELKMIENSNNCKSLEKVKEQLRELSNTLI